MFESPSLLQSGAFTTGIKYRGVTNYRQVKASQRVDVYRNLNQENCFSIRPREGEFKNKVSGYAPCVVVTDVQFVCSLKGQERVMRNAQKDVHAYIRGKFVDAFSDIETLDSQEDVIRVCYNPFVSARFFRCERHADGTLIESSVQYLDTPPEDYPWAIVSGKDVVFAKRIDG